MEKCVNIYIKLVKIFLALVVSIVIMCSNSYAVIGYTHSLKVLRYDADVDVEVLHLLDGQLKGYLGGENPYADMQRVYEDEIITGSQLEGTVHQITQSIGNVGVYEGKKIIPVKARVEVNIEEANSSLVETVADTDDMGTLISKLVQESTRYFDVGSSEFSVERTYIERIVIEYVAVEELNTSTVYHIIKGGDINNENDHVKPVEIFGGGALDEANRVASGVSQIDQPKLATQGTYKNMTIDFSQAYYTTSTSSTKGQVEIMQINSAGDRGIKVEVGKENRIYVCEYEVPKSRVTVYLVEANPAGHNPGYTHNSPMKLQEDLGILGKKYIVDTDPTKLKIIPYTQEYLQTFPDNWYEYFFDNPSIGVSRYMNGVGIVNIPSVLFDIPTSRGDIHLLPEFTHEGKNYKFVASYLACEYTNPLWAPISNLTCTNQAYGLSMFQIMQNPVIIAEYTAEGVPVNVHYVETTGEHSVGASNCKSYLTASALKEKDTYTATANTNYKVKLQKNIQVNGKTYELVNSSVGPNRDFHTGRDKLERDIAVGTEEVHITAEYKEVVIPDSNNTTGSDTDGDGIDDWFYTRTELRLQVLNPLAKAQISADNRNDNNPGLQKAESQKYNNLLEAGKYYGIATHQNQYVQMLTASRNLFDMTYYKYEGTKYYYTTINKTYNAVSWNGPHWVVQCCGDSGILSASSSSSGGSAADGDTVHDNRWHHDAIGCTHTITKLDDCYGGTYFDESGRVHGKGGSCNNGGTKCDWTYSACCGHNNSCDGHEVQDPCTCSPGEDGSIDCPGHSHTEYCDPGCYHSHQRML